MLPYHHIHTKICRHVIKQFTVRYGLSLACFPDEHMVELCERQIVRQKHTHARKTEDLESEITFFNEQ
jgi:hypothetical protein